MSRENRNELNAKNEMNDEFGQVELTRRDFKPSESEDFAELSKRFLSFKEKDVNAHLIGTTFSYLLIILGLLLLYLCLLLFEMEIPGSLLVQMGFVIALQIVIGVLERFRLRRVSRWYKTARQVSESLSEIQGSMFSSVDLMNRLSLLNLILCFIFIFLQSVTHALVISTINNLEIPVYLPNYNYAVYLYNILILLTLFIVLFYLVYLGWRLIIWVKRKKELNQIESTMKNEFPNLKELAELQNSNNIQ
jgi:hypothetical protein